MFSVSFASTPHTDQHDILDEEWREYLVKRMDGYKDADEGTLECKVYRYFQTYLRTLGGRVYKPTICGFTSVTRDDQVSALSFVVSLNDVSFIVLTSTIDSPSPWCRD